MHPVILLCMVGIVGMVRGLYIANTQPPINAIIFIVTPLYSPESTNDQMYHAEVTSIQFVSYLRQHRFRLQPTITALVTDDELLPWFKSVLNNITWRLDAACIKYKFDPYETPECNIFKTKNGIMVV